MIKVTRRNISHPVALSRRILVDEPSVSATLSELSESLIRVCPKIEEEHDASQDNTWYKYRRKANLVSKTYDKKILGHSDRLGTY